MSILLHPEHGVNPRIGMCPRCGGENGEIILIGTYDKKARCGGCNIMMYGLKPNQKCPKCGSRQWMDREEIEQFEKIPTSLCEACQTEVAKHEEIVAAGGVYFRCEDCHTQGVITADDFARNAREQARKDGNTAAATPGADGTYPAIGVLFTKADCPCCGPNPVV